MQPSDRGGFLLAFGGRVVAGPLTPKVLTTGMCRHGEKYMHQACEAARRKPVGRSSDLWENKMYLKTCLRALARTATLSILLAAGAAPGWAANADVTVDVRAVPDAVSVSRLPDLTNYGAIQVTVTPNQNNVINGLVFTSRAKIVNADLTTAPASFKESIPAGACAPTTAGDAVTCAAGQARGGDVLEYVLIYNSPQAGVKLQYDWEFTYSQAGSPTSNSSIISPPGQVFATLTEVNSPQQQKKLKTFVPPGGGTFFTGVRSATLGDLSTTTLTIPTGLGLKIAASIEEDDGVAGGLTNDTLTTNTTTIAVPSTGLFATPVVIVLQRDESTIRSRTQNSANRVPIFYTSIAGETWQVSNQQLPNCADVAGPSATWPVCVDQRIYVKNSMLGTPKPGGGVYTTNDLNDFVFVLKALQNGIGRW